MRNCCLLYEGERRGILLVQSEADERGQYLTVRDVQSPKSIGLVDQRNGSKNPLGQPIGIEPGCLGLPAIGSDRVGNLRRTAAWCCSSGNRKPVEATFHLRSAQTWKGSIDSEGAGFVHLICLVGRVKRVSKLATHFAYADEKPGAATPGFFSSMETPTGSSTPPWISAWPHRTCAAADKWRIGAQRSRIHWHSDNGISCAQFGRHPFLHVLPFAGSDHRVPAPCLLRHHVAIAASIPASNTNREVGFFFAIDRRRSSRALVTAT